ncbi:hypothetical protein HMPREF1981_03416 [Bacteroides pyogenes F0041]|uniref:Uncharacterized protein n=1 Tax=Bacteroides pyogenes F0041 TaxID=1321819 RepID=U2CAJ4_9BACE|nr:hypothetical protein HMPREF1981_03416 [Bacteroides pyogenes F0041]
MDMHPCCRSVYRRAIFPEPRGATDAASQADRRFPMAPRVAGKRLPAAIRKIGTPERIKIRLKN